MFTVAIRGSFLLLGVFVALTASPRCFAWGDLGHSIVGDIAEQLLTPPTRRRIAMILRPTGMGLSEAATWPDLMRSNSDFQNTKISTWHFVELDAGTGLPSAPTNAIWAIQMAEQVLSGRTAPYEVQRINPRLGQPIVIDHAKAIAFIAHLVGDIHQPLHVGNGHDHGANDCLVKWFGDARKDEGFWNLHTVWDEGILERTGLGRTDLVNDLLRRLGRDGRNAFLNARSPGEWAQESAAIRPRVYPQLDPRNPVNELRQPYCNNPRYRNLPGKYAGAGAASHVIEIAKLNKVSDQILGDAEIPRLSYDYRSEHVELAKMQLLKAGVRLAFILERALGN